MKTEVDIYKSLLNDVVFKYIFGYSKNIKFTEYLLELLFNLPLGSLNGKIKIINSFNLEKTSFNERGLELDIKVKMPDESIVNLEAYTQFDEVAELKSLMYICHMFGTQLNRGDKINKAKKHLQINFFKGIRLPTGICSINYENKPIKYLDKYFKMAMINLDDIKEICYNNIKLERLLRLMGASSIKEEQRIIKGDEKLMEMYNAKNEFLQSKWASEFFTNINFYKAQANDVIDKQAEALQEQAEALENTVKALYEKNTSIKEIASITKLDIAKIKEIINKN